MPFGLRTSATSLWPMTAADPLLAVFAEGLGVGADTLSEATSPDNTPQWDSLAAMTLVSLIEETFDVHLKTREIMKMQTIALARQVLHDKGVAGL
jgi:acyl carrier protein